MNWDRIIRFVGSISKALVMLVFYMAGEKTAQDRDDLEAQKRINEQLTQQMIDGGRVRKKYDDLKSKMPDSWSDTNSLRADETAKMPRKNSSPRA